MTNQGKIKVITLWEGTKPRARWDFGALHGDPPAPLKSIMVLWAKDQARNHPHW